MTRKCPLRLERLDDRLTPSFTAPVNHAGDLAAFLAVTGDFNGDGNPDLATANRNEGTISVLRGNGNGTFQLPQTFAAGNYPEMLVVADLNGDGTDDLVARSAGSGPVAVLLTYGDGTLQPPRFVSLPAQVPPDNPDYPALEQTPLSVAVADFDGDGTPDLAVGGQTGYYTWIDPNEPEWHSHNYANVLLGRRDGTFDPAGVKHLPGGYPLVRPGDFNNDGRVDVVVNGGSLLGNGDGTLRDFVPSNIWSDAASTQPARDFNGDGKLDLLSSGPYLQLGNGDGTFQPGVYLDNQVHPHGTTVGDVNADGKLDVVSLRSEYEFTEESGGYTLTATTRSARVLLGNGDGTFAPASVTDFGTVAGQVDYTYPVLTDFDRDGRPDLAMTEVFTEPEVSVVQRGVHVARNDGVWVQTPTASIGDVTVTEGHAGTRWATFTVTLSYPTDRPVTLAYATASGTATAGSDYQAASGTLTIPAGLTTGTITVLVNGDRLGEPNETFVVNLSGATNATIADGQGVGTIVDDEPRITISDVSKAEGKKGQTTLYTFTVTLSAAYDQLVTMSYRTMDGTARTGDSDYVAKTGTLTFAPGETTKTITIEVKGDTKKEANEYFYLDLFDNSSNSLFAKSRGLGTILNDD